MGPALISLFRYRAGRRMSNKDDHRLTTACLFLLLITPTHRFVELTLVDACSHLEQEDFQLAAGNLRIGDFVVRLAVGVAKPGCEL